MTKSHVFCIKRVYDPPSEQDGSRFLVDRLWPRGVRKESLVLDGWFRDAAPSTELRKWFHSGTGEWTEFRRRYLAELAQNPAACEPLLKAVETGNVTLLFAAKDPEINHAAVLLEFLQAKRNAARR